MSSAAMMSWAVIGSPNITTASTAPINGAIEKYAPVVARTSADTSPAVNDPPTEPLLDPDQVLDRVDGDVELLRELVTMFLEDCPRLLEEIEAAVVRRDAEGLARTAHTLKGSIGNFDTGATFEAALRLEMMGREGDLSSVDEAWVALRDAVARFQPALTALAGRGRDVRAAL